MRPEKFRELWLFCRKSWSPKNGLVVRLGKNEDDPKPLLLCVGAMANQGFIAQNCKVWQQDDLLYQGPINDKRLLSLLNQHRVCHAEATTVKLLDVKHGVFRCFGNQATCRKRQCNIKAVKPLQIGQTDIVV